MKYPFVFEMKDVRNVADIDPTSISVDLIGPDGKTVTFNAANVQLDTRPIEKDQARIVIRYETLAQVYSDGKVQPGTKVHIRYSRYSASKAPQRQRHQPLRSSSKLPHSNLQRQSRRLLPPGRASVCSARARNF